MFFRVYITLHYKAHLLRAAFHLLPACGDAFHNSIRYKCNGTNVIADLYYCTLSLHAHVIINKRPNDSEDTVYIKVVDLKKSDKR